MPDYYTPLSTDFPSGSLEGVVAHLESAMRGAEDNDDVSYSDLEHIRDMAVEVRAKLKESETSMGCMNPVEDLLGDLPDEPVYSADEEERAE